TLLTLFPITCSRSNGFFTDFSLSSVPVFSGLLSSINLTSGLSKINLVSFYILCADFPLIRQIDHSLQPAPDIQGLRMSKTGIVQNYCIEFIPVFKASYFSEKG